MGSRMARLTGPVPRMLLGLGVSSVFIIFFLRNTSFSGVADAFREADIALILAGLGVYFAGLYFRAIRWNYLLRPVKSVPPHQLFPILAIGFGMDNVLPLRAGEVVRAHVLHRRHGVSRAAALSSIFMARVFDGMMLTVFLSVGVAASLVGFESMEYAGDVLLAAMAFLVFGVSAAFINLYQIATHPQAAERLVTRVAARTPGLRGGQATWVAPLIQGLRSAEDRHLTYRRGLDQCPGLGTGSIHVLPDGRGLWAESAVPGLLTGGGGGQPDHQHALDLWGSRAV